MHGYGYLYEPNTVEIENLIEKQIKEDPLGYVGEVGIDKNFTHLISLEKQLEIVYSLTTIAISYTRPIVYHINAPMYLMDEIFKLGKNSIPMIIHKFTGSVETAHELYNKGVYVSLSPQVWQKKMKISKRIEELDIPILLETDYTNADETRYLRLLSDHYVWYAKRTDIQYTQLVEQMHELSSVFQSYPITR